MPDRPRLEARPGQRLRLIVDGALEKPLNLLVIVVLRDIEQIVGTATHEDELGLQADAEAIELDPRLHKARSLNAEVGAGQARMHAEAIRHGLVRIDAVAVDHAVAEEDGVGALDQWAAVTAGVGVVGPAMAVEVHVT